MRLLTLKVIQPDETSTALIYVITLTVRAGVTMQLNLLQPPTRSSRIINNKRCKKKTKNNPSRCFYINNELEKRKKEKMLTSVFYREAST